MKLVLEHGVNGPLGNYTLTMFARTGTAFAREMRTLRINPGAINRRFEKDAGAFASVDTVGG